MIRNLAGLALALCGFLLLAPAASAAPDAPNLIPVAYKVVCDEPAVCKRLESRIADLFGKQPGYAVRENFPAARLIVYVLRDSGSKVDPDGYIVAIAHVQNLETHYIAKKLLLEQPATDEGLKGAVTALLNDQGTMSFLNAAHLDDASDAKIEILARFLVTQFFEKTPARPKS